MKKDVPGVKGPIHCNIFFQPRIRENEREQ